MRAPRGPDPLIAALAACMVVLMFGVVTLGALVVTSLPSDPLAFLRSTDDTADTVTDAAPSAPDPAAAEPEPAPAPPVPSSDWKDYPGTAWEDSDELLDALPAEEQTALAETFTSDARSALTGEFGLEWQQVYDDSSYLLDNGYGGESLLTSFSSALWAGTVQLDDAGARAGVLDILDNLLPATSAGELELSNDLYETDPTSAKASFGAAEVDDQAVWRIRGYDALAPGLGVTVRVLDSSLPVDASFDGGYAFEDFAAPGSLTVLIETSNPVMLAAADREAFAERLAGYDESAKPEGEY